MRTIKNEKIRLSNGRWAVLDASELFPGEFETMLLYPGSGEEITSAKASTEAQAICDFDRIRKEYAGPELTGKYAKLSKALKAAREAGKRAAEALGNDGGACNFDAPALYLPRWNQQQVKAAAEAAGVGCFKWQFMGGGVYVFPLRLGYQGNANTAAAEEALDCLIDAGYNGRTYYEID